MALRHLALSYHITAHHSSEFRHSCRLYLVAEGVAALISERAIEEGGTPKNRSRAWPLGARHIL
jgi:hypothetical protein